MDTILQNAAVGLTSGATAALLLRHRIHEELKVQYDRELRGDRRQLLLRAGKLNRLIVVDQPCVRGCTR